MTDELFKNLNLLIKQNCISVQNSPTETSYMIPYENAMFYLDCQFSHTTDTNLYAQYELYFEEFLFDSEKYPLLGAKNKINNDAKKLHYLARQCSLKIIKQEQEAQKIGMLKNLGRVRQ